MRGSEHSPNARRLVDLMMLARVGEALRAIHAHFDHFDLKVPERCLVDGSVLNAYKNPVSQHIAGSL